MRRGRDDPMNPDAPACAPHDAARCVAQGGMRRFPGGIAPFITAGTANGESERWT